jgi:hypothetical protein
MAALTSCSRVAGSSDVGSKTIGADTSWIRLRRPAGGAPAVSPLIPSAALISAIEGPVETTVIDEVVRWMRWFMRSNHSGEPNSIGPRGASSCAGSGADSVSVGAVGTAAGGAAATRATCRCDNKLCSEEPNSAFRAITRALASPPLMAGDSAPDP